MSYTIVHLLDREAPNGVYTMVEELHWAFDKYHPKHKQKIIVSGDERLNPDFTLEREYSGHHHLLKKLEGIENPIVVFHKLMNSDAHALGKIVHGNFPFVILNHTFSSKIHYMGRCDALVSVSEYMHKHLKKLFPALNNVFIRNGVNQERFESAQPRDFGSIDPNEVFMTGRINALNSHKYSEEFVNWICSTEWPKKMVHEYIGKGNFLHEAKRLSKRLHRSGAPNRCNFMGPMYTFSRKLSYMKSWNLFLYEINRHEGTSMSVLEALACGIPVVCSDHYGNKELIVQEVNGFVYQNRKEARRFVSRCMLEPEFLANLKKTTKQHFAEHLDMRISAAKYIELFDSLAKG